MPTKLLLALLLIFGSLIPAHVCEKESDEESQDRRAKAMNKMRRVVAKEVQVANMNKVSYDEDLEEKVIASCDEVNSFVKMANSLGQAPTDSKGKAYEKDLGMISGYTYINCFHPLQTGVACKDVSCRSDGEVTKFGACVCGPKTSFSSSDWIKGKPGTKCEGSEDDGLCEAREPPTTVKLNTVETHENDYEKDGSSNSITIGVIVNLIIFYLLATFL
ncbi:unnamed protein product [Caenorhabditis nigoni]